MQPINIQSTKFTQNVDHLAHRAANYAAFFSSLKSNASFQNVLIIFRRYGVSIDCYLKFLTGKASLEECLVGDSDSLTILTSLCSRSLKLGSNFFGQPDGLHFLNEQTAKTLSAIIKRGPYESAGKTNDKYRYLISVIENEENQGILDFSNADFSGKTFSLIKIENACFMGANFQGVTFYPCDFTNCNFQNANFTGARFTLSNFVNCNFQNANFTLVIFTGMDFRGANFKQANFTWADFWNVNGEGANLEGANFKGATADNNDRNISRRIAEQVEQEKCMLLIQGQKSDESILNIFPQDIISTLVRNLVLLRCLPTSPKK